MQPPIPVPEEFPLGHAGSLVCYFEIVPGGLPEQCRYRDDLREAVRRALAGESKLYAVWSGQYRSDLFVFEDDEDLKKLAVRIKA